MNVSVLLYVPVRSALVGADPLAEAQRHRVLAPIGALHVNRFSGEAEEPTSLKHVPCWPRCGPAPAAAAAGRTLPFTRCPCVCGLGSATLNSASPAVEVTVAVDVASYVRATPGGRHRTGAGARASATTSPARCRRPGPGTGCGRPRPADPGSGRWCAPCAPARPRRSRPPTGWRSAPGRTSRDRARSPCRRCGRCTSRSTRSRREVMPGAVATGPRSKYAISFGFDRSVKSITRHAALVPGLDQDVAALDRDQVADVADAVLGRASARPGACSSS